MARRRRLGDAAGGPAVCPDRPLLAGHPDVKGKIVVAVLSGGNVDPELFHRLVA